MKKDWLIFLTIVVVIIMALISFYFYQKNHKIATIQNTPASSQITASQISTPATTTNIIIEPTLSQTQTNALAKPVVDFKARITKKPFGIYITPETSPVQPEKFSGYHNAVDVEYGDVSDDVEIHAAYDGTVIYSGYVSGYGGFVAIQHDFNGEKIISIYGHLDPDSQVDNGAKVIKGDKIGILGEAYSNQTDGERKHLHFAIIKGEKLDFRGYVQSESELSLWQNPLDYF